jgi:membrane protein YqaA with SNARE-associated domain
MASIIEFLIVFITAFGANSIPFAGPSNILIPSWFPFILVNGDAPTLLLVGFLVALAAALAKGIHYMITFFVRDRLSEKRRAHLDAEGVKVRRWAFLLLFVAAASPIPDEPIVIPLGLMKYSPPKFFLSYFLGKLTIAVAGAFLGKIIESSVSGWLSPEFTIVISIVLTILITVILLKVDIGKLNKRILNKKHLQKAEGEQEKLNNPSLKA